MANSVTITGTFYAYEVSLLGITFGEVLVLAENFFAGKTSCGLERKSTDYVSSNGTLPPLVVHLLIPANVDMFLAMDFLKFLAKHYGVSLEDNRQHEPCRPQANSI